MMRLKWGGMEKLPMLRPLLGFSGWKDTIEIVYFETDMCIGLQKTLVKLFLITNSTFNFKVNF